MRGDATTGINAAGLRHRSEDRAGHGDAAVCQPGIEGCLRTAGRVDDSFAVALADDANCAGVRVVVGDLHGDRFGAAHAAAEQQGEGGCIAGSGRGAVGTDGKQCPDLGGLKGPARGQAGAADGRHVNGPVIGIGRNQLQAPRCPEYTTDCGEGLVRRGGRVALGQHGPKGGNVVMAQFVPGAGRGIAATEHGGELGERGGHRAPPLTGSQACEVDDRWIALRGKGLDSGDRRDGHGSSRLPGTCIPDQLSSPSGDGAINKLTALAAVVALSGGLVACGGGGGSTAAMNDKKQMTQSAQQKCEAAGDVWIAHSETCVSAETQAAIDENNRVRGVDDATKAAKAAVSDAKMAKTAADRAASAAEQARDDARDAYMKAMAARTDSATAKAEYETAKAAAGAARAAAHKAQAAYMAAMMAAEGIDADGTVDDANAAKMTAETKQDETETAKMTAETKQGEAEAARMKAAEAAGTHVLMLFLAANGAHVMDDEDTMDVDETAAHVTSVGAAMAAIAAVAEGAQAAGTTVTITHPGDTVDNPATEDDSATLETVENNEFVEGMLGITVNVAGATEIGGTAIPFELRPSRAATDLNGDGDTDDTGEAAYTQTAMMIDGLGVFTGYELWEDDGDAATNTDRARAILFTDKQKGDDSVLAVTAATARTVENAAVDTTTLTMLGTKSGNTYTGAQYTPSGEAALTGTLTCPSGVTCSVDATTAADGTVTINVVTGYVFTGSREAVEAVTAADATENNNYLAFGLWLEESDDGTTDTFGSFAVGGTDYAVGAPAVTLTGTATYSGKAAGAHHRTGDGVNWFHGDARLTADFGAANVAGTIMGEISNIRVNGGSAMSDSIHLREADLVAGTATFNGMARMGAGEIQDDDTVEYPYNGTWSGSFFGATANDADTTDVDESITAPMAAAGTFGVTRTMDMDTTDMDDDIVESFVGAFGAHLDD